MSRILICGMTTYDIVLNTSVIPTEATKYVASEATLICGGGAANAAIAASRLGAEVRLAGRLGDDIIGDLIMGHLVREQIDCTLLRRITGARSAFSTITVDENGERQIVNFRGENLTDYATWISGATGIDAVLTDTRWTQGAVTAMKLAKVLGVPGVLDAEAPLLPEAMALASHIAFSQEGLAALSQTNDPVQGLMQAAAEFDAWLCVTDGENGVFSIDMGQVQHSPAFKVTTIDTLGAGDVWHGAFCLALAQQKKEADAISYANAVAALKCTRPGGGQGAPTAAEVIEFLSRHNQHSDIS